MKNSKIEDFMLEEYKQIANAYKDLHAQANELVRSYLTLVALPVTVLAVVIKILGSQNGNEPNGLSDATRIGVPIIILFMIALCLVGHSVFRALVANRIEALLYVRTVNCIRRFFVEHTKDFDLRRYLVLPDYDLRTPPFNEGPSARYFWNVRMVQILNAIILIVTIWSIFCWAQRELNQYWPLVTPLVLFKLVDYLVILKWLAPLAFGLIYFYIQAFMQDRILDKQEYAYKPKFGPYKRIGVDLDGVLADLAEGVVRKANSEYGLGVSKEDITSHDIAQCLRMSHDQVKSIFASDDIFVDLNPVSGSKRAIKLLHKKGWIIHVITDRFWHENDWSLSRAWLKSHAFHWNHLNLVRASQKAEYASAHEIQYFVEDNLDTARALGTVCEKVFLLDELYNKGDIPDNVIRISNWKQIVSFLEKLPVS